MQLGQNKIMPGELCLAFDAHWQSWSRVLYMAHGTYIEIDLCPVGRTIKVGDGKAWDSVRSIRIRRHSHARGPGDKQYRNVIRQSGIYTDILAMMRPHLKDVDIAILLHREFLPEIDWKKYLAMPKGGPVFFAEVMKKQTEYMVRGVLVAA